MTNLAALMKGRVEDLVKGPKALPIGDYPGVIKKFEGPPADGTVDGKLRFRGKDGNVYQKLRFWATPTSWPDTVSEDQKEGIDNLASRQIPCDYWLPVGRDYGLLCTSCGISGAIDEQTNYQLVGHPVLICVAHEVDKRGETWAKATKLIGTR